MPTEAQVRQAMLKGYQAKGINPTEENLQNSIDSYFKKASNDSGFSAGKRLYDAIGDEAAASFTEQLAFNMKNHGREFKSGTVGMAGYLVGALGLDNTAIVDYSEELRADGQRAMLEEIRNDVGLQALLAWQEDDPVTFTGEDANFWEWSMIKRGAASALPSLIEITATSVVGYLTGMGGVALASKIGKGLSASKKAVTAAKLAKTEGKLSDLATAFKTANTVDDVALAMTKRGIYDKTSRGLAMAGMTGLEGSSQYNEAMRYLVDEEGMSIEEASDKAGLSAVMYAPIAGALEYLPMGHWAKGMGIWKKGTKEGTKIFSRAATKLSKKLAEQKLPVRMLSGAVSQAAMEATTEWSQYMAQVAMDEAFVKGDYATPEEALEAVTNRWKESAFDVEARESIYGGFLMGAGMGSFNPAKGVKGGENKNVNTLAGQALAAAEEAQRPTTSATTEEAENIISKAGEEEDTFTSDTTPETEDERNERLARERAEKRAEENGARQSNVPENTGQGAPEGEQKRSGKRKSFQQSRNQAATYKSQILRNPLATKDEKDEANLAWEIGKKDSKKWGEISEELGALSGKIRSRSKTEGTQDSDLTPEESDKLMGLIMNPDFPSVDRSVLHMKPREQRKLMADLDSPVFQKPKAGGQIDVNDKKITISRVREIAETNEIEIPTKLKLRADIIGHVNAELGKKTETPTEKGKAKRKTKLIDEMPLKGESSELDTNYFGSVTSEVTGSNYIVLFDENGKRVDVGFVDGKIETTQGKKPSKFVVDKFHKHIKTARSVMSKIAKVYNSLGAKFDMTSSHDRLKVRSAINNNPAKWKEILSDAGFNQEQVKLIVSLGGEITASNETTGGINDFLALYEYTEVFPKKNQAEIFAIEEKLLNKIQVSGTPTTKAETEITFKDSPELSQEMSNVNEEHKPLAKSLATAIEKIGKKVRLVYDETIRTAGNAEETDTELIIRINNKRLAKTSKDRGRVILHEATHLVTARDIREWEKSPTRQADENDAVTRLSDLYGQTLLSMAQEDGNAEFVELMKKKRKLDKEGKELSEAEKKRGRELQKEYYGLVNLREFASEVMTSKVFQERLKNIEVSGENMSAWEKFIDIIKDILGVEADFNVLTEALSAVVEIAGLESETEAKVSLSGRSVEKLTEEIKALTSRTNEEKDADLEHKAKVKALIAERAELEGKPKPKTTKKPETKKPAQKKAPQKKKSRGAYKRTTHGGKVAGGLYEDFDKTASIRESIEADVSGVDVKGLLSRTEGLRQTKLGVKRYGSVEALSDNIKAYYNGTIKNQKLNKSMGIFVRNYWNAIDKSMRDADFSDLIDRENPINDFADFQTKPEASDPNGEIPNQNGTEKNIFVGWLGVDMTSKEYAQMLEKVKEFGKPSEYAAWLEKWLKETFDRRVPDERRHILDKGLTKQVRNIVYSFYQKKHSKINRWFPGIRDKFARLYFEVEYVAKQYRKGRYKHEKAGWVTVSEQQPDRTVDLAQNKPHPKYETSNFTEQDQIEGRRTDEIRTVHLSASQITNRNHRQDGSIFHGQYRQGITPELMSELDIDFSERWEFDDFDALLTVIGAKGGGRTELILTIVEEKWHNVLTVEQFKEYLDGEINPVDEKGNKLEPRLTEKHKFEFVKSAEGMEGKFRFAQLIGQHEWAKANRHNRYAMPGYWKGIEDFLNRLRIDMAEGYNIRGLQYFIDNKRINNKLMIIPKETIVEHNGKQTTYAKFDGATFTSRRWFKVVQDLIGQNPIGENEFDLSFVKSVFRHRSEDGMDYLGAKHAQFVAPVGMKFINPETGKVIAEVKMNKVGDKSILVDAQNNEFDHISSDNEIKNKAGKFEEYYTLNQLGEDDIKILFTGNNEAKDVSATPYAATEFMLTHQATDTIKRVVNILKDNYVEQASEYIDELYSFLDGKEVDGKHVSGAQLLVEEMKRDMLAGETPSEIQLLIGIDPSGSLLLHPSSTMELTAYFNNKYLLDTAYKGRRSDGSSTQAYVKPQVGMDIGRGEVKFSIGNKPMLREAQKAYTDAMNIKLEEFQNLPEIEMIQLLNEWLETEDGFFVLGSRQPVNKWTAVRPFRVTGFDVTSIGSEVFHNYEDVMEILEGDWDGDKTYFDAFRKVDDELLSAYRDVIKYDIADIDRKLPLTHFSPKLDSGDRNSFANLADRQEVAENIMAADGAVGLSVSNAAIFKSLAFKNFKITFSQKGKEDVVYEIQQPTGENLEANYTFQIPLLLSEMQKKEEYDIATQATDKIWNDKGQEMSYAQVKKWKKEDGNLWLRTTREHAFSLITQMATDDAKFGLLSKLYNPAQTTLKDFITQDIMFGQEIKNKKHLKKIKNNISMFNSLQKRQGKINGKGMNLEQNIATSMQLDDLYSESDRDTFLGHLNKSFLQNKTTKTSSVFVEIDNAPTPMEELIRTIGRKQLARVTESSTGMFTSNPLRHEESYELFAHYQAIIEIWDDYNKIIGDISLEDQTEAVSALEDISKDFYFILQEYFDENGKVKDNVRIDKNEMFDLFKEENLPIYESLTDAQKAVANMRFLTGSFMERYDERKKRDVLTRRVRKDKLLPAKFLHPELISLYAKKRIEILDKIKSADGIVSAAYKGQRLRQPKEIYKNYQRNLKNWTFRGIEKVLFEIESQNIVDEFEDFSESDSSEKEKEAYRVSTEVLVNNMVGIVSQEDIDSAKGINKSRLRAAKGLNDAIYADIVNIGGMKGWDIKEISSQIQGWNDMLSRFNGGIPITPATVMFGERKAMALLKRANNMMNRRTKLINKSKKTNNMSLWERAIGRPEVVMFMWDKTGIANRIVEKATKVGDSAQQVFNKMYSPIGKQLKIVNDSLTKATSLVEGGITLGNAGVGTLEYKSKEGNTYIIEDNRRNNGIVQYFVASKYDKDGNTEVVKKWIDADFIQLAEDEFNLKLIEKISSEFVYEIMSGQSRHVEFYRVDGYKEFKKKHKGIYNRIDKKATDPKHPEYRHTFKSSGVTYQYVMIKSDEGKLEGNLSMPETYLAFIVNMVDEHGNYTNFLEGSNSTENTGDIAVPDKAVPSSGWFRADHASNIEREDGATYKGFVEFQRMRQQPHKDLFTEEDTFGLWGLVNENRTALYNMFNFVQGKTKKTELILQKYVDSLRVELGKRFPKKMSQDERKEAIDEYIKENLLSGDIDGRLYLDRHGKIRTGNTGFREIFENYMPRMYPADALYDMIDTEHNNIEIELNDRKNELLLAKTKRDRDKIQKEVDKLEEDFKHINNIRNYDFDIAEGTPEEINRNIVSRQILSAKKRKPFTRPELARKDSAVLSDYMNQTLSVAFNNELVAELVQSLSKMLKTGLNEDVVDYTVNKVKQGVGDAGTRGLFGKDRQVGSYKWVANLLNKLPFVKEKYNADSARTFILHAGGFVSMRFLGATGALQNNTQIANAYIREGIGPISDAWGYLHSDDRDVQAMWRERVSRTGVENTLSMFEIYMTKDGKTKGTDFFTFPGTIVPSKNMVDWVKLLKLSKKEFANGKGGEFEKLDKFIAKFQDAYPGAKGKNINYVRQALYDLMKTDKIESQDIKLVESRIRNLFGDLAKDKFRAAVTWKLSWWLDKAPGKELFTFTEGEKNMRRVTALTAIIGAVKRGLISIPESYHKKYGKEAFSHFIQSDELYSNETAIDIGRKAVYATMFGMSEVHLGEGFTGVFKLLNQFRGYPVQQTQFEFDTIRSFFDGSKNKQDSIARLHRAQMAILKRVLSGKKNINIYNDFADHDAIVMLRLLYTRFLASSLTVLLRTIPMTGAIIRKISPFEFGYSMIRGAESPALSFTLKMSTWGILAMMGFDDDDNIYEKMSEDGIRSLLMFTTPAILGMLARDVTNFGEWFSAINDDASFSNILKTNPLIGQ